MRYTRHHDITSMALEWSVFVDFEMRPPDHARIVEETPHNCSHSWLIQRIPFNRLS